jgi:peptide/nickel transport system substrate-binding protein
MEPPPEGLWGMPSDMLRALPGYGTDLANRRAEARQIMERLGYGPGRRLAVTVSARNIPAWRDPAVILIDQLKEIYIDGELDPVDTTQWYPRLMRKDFKIGLNVTESEVDDPDAQFYENYVCGALRNYTGYCNTAVDELVDRQSREPDANRRRRMVWQIETKLIEEDARPDILYVSGANCRQPQVKGLISMVNSIYNGSRFEDLWLDR